MPHQLLVGSVAVDSGLQLQGLADVQRQVVAVLIFGPGDLDGGYRTDEIEGELDAGSILPDRVLIFVFTSLNLTLDGEGDLAGLGVGGNPDAGDNAVLLHHRREPGAAAGDVRDEGGHVPVVGLNQIFEILAEVQRLLLTGQGKVAIVFIVPAVFFFVVPIRPFGEGVAAVLGLFGDDVDSDGVGGYIIQTASKEIGGLGSDGDIIVFSHRIGGQLAGAPVHPAVIIYRIAVIVGERNFVNFPVDALIRGFFITAIVDGLQRQGLAAHNGDFATGRLVLNLDFISEVHTPEGAGEALGLSVQRGCGGDLGSADLFEGQNAGALVEGAGAAGDLVIDAVHGYSQAAIVNNDIAIRVYPDGHDLYLIAGCSMPGEGSMYNVIAGVSGFTILQCQRQSPFVGRCYLNRIDIGIIAIGIPIDFRFVIALNIQSGRFGNLVGDGQLAVFVDGGKVMAIPEMVVDIPAILTAGDGALPIRIVVGSGGELQRFAGVQRLAIVFLRGADA